MDKCNDEGDLRFNKEKYVTIKLMKKQLSGMRMIISGHPVIQEPPKFQDTFDIMMTFDFMQLEDGNVPFLDVF